MIEPYPLLFEPILKPKVWGGRRLARYGKRLVPGENIGESWEIADLGATSVSGGGGEAARSVIANGLLRGRTLHEAMDLWGAMLMGQAARTASGDFPLLVKFLDAQEHLSVQVHPSPAYAAAHPEANLKTECWYVMDAECYDEGREPAVLFKGLKPGVTRADLRRAIENESVPRLLEAVEATPGDCHNLPSGTIHALGRGVLVAEVQTPSDTTFRAYDWRVEYRREGRELHIEEALECADFGPALPATRLPAGRTRAPLAATPFFVIEENVGEAGVPAGRPSPTVVMAVEGEGELVCGGERLRLQPGTTVLVPAVSSFEVVAARPLRTLLITIPG